MTHFSIKDLEAFSGVKKHTIRIWEQRYAFLQPKRTEALRRLYTPEELTLLLNVARLNQGGLRVSHIAKLIRQKDRPEINNIAIQQLKAVHDLIIAMAEMDMIQFEAVLEEAIDLWGMDDALQKVIIPFCDRVGLLQKVDQKSYLENVILITETIKRKFYAAIDQIKPLLSPNKTVFFFLLKGEWQTLPILYLQYLLKKEGYNVHYLGEHITIENLTNLVSSKQPDYLITTQMEKSQRMELLQFVKHLPSYSVSTNMITYGTALPKAEHLNHYQHCDSLQQVTNLFLND